MTLLDTENMPHKVAVKGQRVSLSEAGGDGVTEFVRKSLPCWIQNASNSEITDFERRGERISHKVFFNEDPRLKKNDLLVPDDEATVHAHKPQKVIAVADRSAGLGALYAAFTMQELRESTDTTFQ